MTQAPRYALYFSQSVEGYGARLMLNTGSDVETVARPGSDMQPKQGGQL